MFLLAHWCFFLNCDFVFLAFTGFCGLYFAAFFDAVLFTANAATEKVGVAELAVSSAILWGILQFDAVCFHRSFCLTVN